MSQLQANPMPWASVPTVIRFCRSGQGHVQVPLMPNSILRVEHVACSFERRDSTCFGFVFQIVMWTAGRGSKSSRTSASFEEICRRSERVSQIGRGGQR